jgi:hypothetical protein
VNTAIEAHVGKGLYAKADYSFTLEIKHTFRNDGSNYEYSSTVQKRRSSHKRCNDQ